MKRLTVPALLAFGVLLLGACTDDQSKRAPRSRPGFNPPPPRMVDNPPADSGNDRAPSEEHSTTTTTTTGGTTTAPPSTVPVGSPEYGKPVPGKPGFVTSPYAPAAGYVDVRGFPPGTEVKDPYTGKIFLVP